MHNNARAHSWRAKVCFAMGKHASQWMGQTDPEANLSYNLLVTLHFLWSSGWWFPLLIQSLTRFSSSSLFPLNFNPLHFNHRFNWPTVYSSGSLSNLEPGTSSSSVRTVKHGSEPLAIHTFPLQSLQKCHLFVWLTTGVENFVTSL